MAVHGGVLAGSTNLNQVACEEGARGTPAGRVLGFGAADAGAPPRSLPHPSRRTLPSCQSQFEQVYLTALVMAVVLHTCGWECWDSLNTGSVGSKCVCVCVRARTRALYVMSECILPVVRMYV